MFGKLKLVHKLVFILLVIALFPILIIGITYYHFTKAELEQKTIAALQAVVDSRAAHINHYIKLRQEQAKAFAGAFFPRQLKETGVNEPALIQGIQDDISSIFFFLNLTPSGRYQDIDQKTDVQTIGVWDVHGNIIASTNRELVGRKMPIEYIQNVYQYGTYFAGLEKDPLTGENMLILLEEIRNWQSGNIVGALSLMIKADVLDKVTSAREGLGHSGETYLVDRQYRIITNSRFQKDSILNVRVMTEGTQACFQRRKAPLIYANYRNADVLGVQKYLPDQNWCLMAEVDANEAFAPIQQFHQRLLLTGLLMLLVTVLLAFWASRIFTRPILALNEASQKVSRGQYNVKLPVKNRDEIGQLSTNFNFMAKRLAEVKEELEEKNKTLFKHLAVLASQKKELREVNEELDRFVYTASHDLRAPLRGIASFAAFLEEDYKDRMDAQGREYLDEIRKGAAKMNMLIEDLLLLSRISRIKNPYELTDIQKLVDSVLERLKYDIQKHSAAIQIATVLPTVCCDRIKMTEVFQNLINNAIKFSSKKDGAPPRVDIGYRKDGISHCFYVKDHGIGIDPKYHEQIFGMFKRLHTDKEYEGTGAGLSIIKRIIEDHSGRVWVESRAGEGATFFFNIPADLKAGEGASPPPAGESA
ncbi:MAG TPA: ATP-binding protein [Candidatus Omnitrophota bacterium]|nr:HAMP domain-containing protein [Candidatus Omnitrophota bacterium]HQO58509.1 ATP-binding protein [Candidatus Omnitrophota bacterium]